MSSSARSTSLLSILLISCSVASAEPEGEKWESSAYIAALDCLMPVPSGYVVTTEDPSQISLFKREQGLAGGRISIVDVKSFEIGSKLEKISETKMGHISMTRSRYTGDAFPGMTGQEFVVIRGSRQVMVFQGSATAIADLMAESCIANRGG